MDGNTAEIHYSRTTDGTLSLRLSGMWTMGAKLPLAEDVMARLSDDEGKGRVRFDTNGMTGWDSRLLVFLIRLQADCARHEILWDETGLPSGVQKLLALATAVPERKGARKVVQQVPLLEHVGQMTMQCGRATTRWLAFIGEAFVALVRLLTGKARFRRSDLFLFIQECGVDALPIVTLISALVGLILAFVGAIQLMMFGAQIYVANLVGIAMVRVIGAVMTGVVMAGRTGAAFAAQLGTMQVNEEIDALKTMGITPMEFLVLPRMLALVLMMPLLCVYADLMGVAGGMLVGVGLLDIGFTQYLHQTRDALSLTHFFIGIFQAGVFGVLVALAGCFKGIQCGRSASAVGSATTSAVVTSIVAITVATAVITVVCDVLNI
jgi:phospholipid/cholesterol/gamma-HCH transport system permease protein